MRVAYLHDWLVTYRGGEKVLAALLELYPEAPLYTLFYDRSAMPDAITRRDIRVPWALNALRRGRKALLPVLPHAVESLDLDAFDLVISTSSCVAKGAVTRKGATHLCYLHSPMRYIWDQQDEYLKGVAHIPGAVRGIKALTPWLRRWDVSSAQRVDRFVANSTFVADRARRYYGMDASVVHPPVELERFVPRLATSEREGYVLAAGALVSYKRFDLAIKACAALGRRLVIAGSGPMEAALQRLAQGSKTEFVKGPDDATFTRLLQEADALLFPGVEDFGMIAVEAMACGTPVIAFAAGGARDFIAEGTSGVFFGEGKSQDDAGLLDDLVSCLRAFDPRAFDARALNQYARRYGKPDFLDKMRREIGLATESARA